MKALFIGLGGVGQRHLRNLKKIVPKAKIGAIRHTNKVFEIKDNLEADKNVDITEKYSIQKFNDLESAVKWKPDLAIISTPSHYHVEPSLKLIKNNIPVFLEKPISTDLKSLNKLYLYTEKSNSFIMVGYMLKFHPGIVYLQKKLKENVLGNLYSAQFNLCSFMPSWHPYEDYTQLYASKKDLGGGVILTAVHPIDILYDLFGLPESVFCIGGKVSDFNINVEDTVSALLEYKINNRCFPVNLNLSFVQKPIQHTINIWGDKGRLSWDEISGEVKIVSDFGSDKTFKDKKFKRNDMFYKEMQYFIKSVKDNIKPNKNNFLQVLKGHELALKIKKSLEKNKVIR